MSDILSSKKFRRTALTVVFWCASDEDDHVIDYDKANILYNFALHCIVPSCCSPIHDQDVNSIDADTGEVHYKKVHIHYVVDMGKLQTIRQWLKFFEPIRDMISIAPFDNYDFSDLNEADPSGWSEKFKDILRVWENENSVKNMRGLLRYFHHWDNPEKFQYNDALRNYGGFDSDTIILSQSDSVVLLDQIIEWIDNNDCYSFANLIRYCRDHNRDWFLVMARYRYSDMVINYMRSLAYTNSGALDRQIDKWEDS